MSITKSTKLNGHKEMLKSGTQRSHVENSASQQKQDAFRVFDTVNTVRTIDTFHLAHLYLFISVWY